jgi:hypothetical protein
MHKAGLRVGLAGFSPSADLATMWQRECGNVSVATRVLDKRSAEVTIHSSRRERDGRIWQTSDRAEREGDSRVVLGAPDLDRIHQHTIWRIE